MKIIKRYSRYFLLTLLVFFTLTPLSISAETNHEAKLNYVALGNSLAAGFLNDPPLTIGKGYPVFIEEGIEEKTAYKIELANFGIGGYKTDDVLKQVRSIADVRDKIESADLITLDIGANDLLGAVDIGGIDPGDPASINDAIENATEALEKVTINMNSILSEIRTLNEDAPIYVMGYYNALHYLDNDALQGIISTVMGYLNDVIATSASNYDAYYVPTFDAFEGKYEQYLPKPDIHPNEAGYEVIANLFLEQIIPNLEPIETPDTEPPVITLLGDNPMELEVGDDYLDPGATAEDNVDGDLTDQIKIQGNINTDKPGESEIIYSVTDAAGNEGKAVRVVKIVRKEITKNDDPKETKEQEEGVIAMDKSAPEGGRLPNTATNIPLFLLIGQVFFLTGGMVLLANNNRRKMNG